jgi:hypothetical protein
VNAVRQGRPVRRPGVWLVIQAGVSLYDQSTGNVHLVNQGAAAIWDLCDGETSPDEMIEAICDISGTPREVVEEDVERILTEFESAHLITWRES